MRWFSKRIIEEWKKKKEQRAKELLAAKKEAEEWVEQMTKKMTSKFCPIINRSCSRDCAHFQKGQIFLVEEWLDFPAMWIPKPPRCKLWSKES